MDMINMFRAEVCANLKDEHGTNFKSFAKCKEFMEEACKPGDDMIMDRDQHEITTRKGYCREYFSEQETEKELEDKVGKEEAKKMIDEEEAADAAPAPAP